MELKEILGIVAKGNLKEGIQAIKLNFLNNKIESELIQLESRLSDLSTKEVKGIISIENQTIERNKISSSLIDVIQKLKVTSKRVENKDIVKIKFIDNLYPDEISIKKLATKKLDSNLLIEINFSPAVNKLISDLDKLISQVEERKSEESIFYNTSQKERNLFYEDAISAKETSIKIINNAPKRIKLLIDEMKDYWGEIRTNSHHIKTIENYLILCNHKIIHSISYALSYPKSVKEKYLSEEFEELLELAKTNNGEYKKLFSIDEEIYKANILYFSDEYFNNYFWGKKSHIIGAYKHHQHTITINNWVREYLIPQVELQHTLYDEDKRLIYSEKAQINKILDENGDETY